METNIESSSVVPKRARPATGSRIPSFKADVTKALLNQGFPQRMVAEAMTLSRPVIQVLAHQKVASSARAEKVKRGLRDRWALLADSTLNGITKGKIQESSAKELAYIAAKATEMAGLAPPSIVESYHQSLNAFVIEEPANASAQVVQAEAQAKSE